MDRHNITEWSVRGYFPYVPSLFFDNVEQMSITGKIKATVPGSVYKDLLSAGIIKEPFYSFNSRECEWVSNRWWVYTAEFSGEQYRKQTKKVLHFEGIDNLASIRLNGKILEKGRFANKTCDIDITAEIQDKNVLDVIIESEQQENNQFGRTSEISTQKARNGYKWDFCLRLVDIGISGEVYIKEFEYAGIENFYFDTDYKNGVGTIRFEIESIINQKGEYFAEISLIDGYNNVKSKEIKIEKENTKGTFDVDNVALWYPSGYGAAKLYTVVLRLKKGCDIIDEKRELCGFKTVRLLQNSDTPSYYEKFLFEINGEKVYLKGFNYVPYELYRGCQQKDVLEKLVELVKKSNANIIRVWGGGNFAPKELLELCSKNGIMVWQDFLQTGSGTDSFPNCNEAYMQMLKDVSVKQIKNMGHYPCITVWCGGNELRDDTNKAPVRRENKNVELLQKILEESDVRLPFFPSSPFGGNFNYEKGTENNQNVHGFYKYYCGEYGIFHNEYYNASNSTFHAEFGVDGVSCISTLRKILPTENLTVTDSARDYLWKHFGDWWDTLTRDEGFFGKMDSLEDYIYASQYLQAEGLRYIIESDRRRAYHNSGCLVWQLNEPNPNTSCTSVIDFYLNPKQAYYAVQKAYQPVLGCVKYEKLKYSIGEEIPLEFYLINETDKERELKIKIIADDYNTIFEETYDCLSLNGIAGKVCELKLKNSYNYGIRIDMESGEYKNSVLLLSEKEGKCSLEYVKRQDLWSNYRKTVFGNRMD